MRSLVTGGAGFIGSNLVDALVEAGDVVMTLDDLSTGRRSNLASAEQRGVELVVGSIADTSLLSPQLQDFKPDRVFHLAAQIDVRRAVTEPQFDAEINVVGTINVLEAAHLAGAQSVLFASTGGAIYGEGKDRDLPLREDTPNLPEAGYGASKLAAETYVSLYGRLHGLPGASLRFANVYGPRQDPLGEAGVVAIFCGQLSRNEPLSVIGDGLQTRDYVFVDDVVDALIAADEKLREDKGAGLPGPLNIGTGIETSVLELAEQLGAAAGAGTTVEHLPERAGEVQRIAIDPRAAEQVLGWSPSVDLREGLRRTYAALDSDVAPAAR